MCCCTAVVILFAYCSVSLFMSSWNFSLSTGGRILSLKCFKDLQTVFGGRVCQLLRLLRRRVSRFNSLTSGLKSGLLESWCEL